VSGGLSRWRLLRHVAGVQRVAWGLRLRRSAGPRGARFPLRLALLPPAPGSVAGISHRVHGWKPHLEARGFEVRLLEPCAPAEFAGLLSGSPAGADAFRRAALASLRRNLREALAADLVVVHRGLLPFSPWQRPALEVLLARKGPPLVLDQFDAVWVQRDRARAALRSAAGRWLTPPDGLERAMAAAAGVTVSGENLAGYARLHNPRVHVLPMVVDPSRYPAKGHGDASPVVLGWTGNPGNLSRLASIVPALRRAAEGRRLRLRVVSSAPFAAEGLEVDSATHPWTPANEASDLLSFDLGLLPVFDEPYDRGKFPFKLLQYAAAGLPCVASPVAVDPGAFVHGESILFAASEGEWAEAVGRLADDPALRARIGGAARAVVRERFSYEVHADPYAAFLRSVASGTGVREGV
jgi:glycosyltransferase involved in cell wall biosynthesis